MTRVNACAMPGCGRPTFRDAKYCCRACANEARRKWHDANPGGNYPIPKQLAHARGLRSAQQQNARRQRERAVATAEPILEPQTPARPVHRLDWNPRVVIRPPRPAPVKRYRDTGRPTPFQDDMNAIADHGSAGRFPAPAWLAA